MVATLGVTVGGIGTIIERSDGSVSTSDTHSGVCWADGKIKRIYEGSVSRR